MTVAQRERAALVETLRSADPAAPTLCEGWTVRDLTAHLVLREYRPDASAGILIPWFAGYTAKVQDGMAADTPYPQLVDKVAAGPPLYSPFKLLDAVANPVEMFVHHEDVRRAQPNWEPRALDAATTAALRRPLRLQGKMSLGKVPVRLTLRTRDGAEVFTTGSGPAVTITGDPGELILFTFGRDEVRVDFDGDDAAVVAVRNSKRGF